MASTKWYKPSKSAINIAKKKENEVLKTWKVTIGKHVPWKMWNIQAYLDKWWKDPIWWALTWKKSWTKERELTIKALEGLNLIKWQTTKAGSGIRERQRAAAIKAEKKRTANKNASNFQYLWDFWKWLVRWTAKFWWELVWWVSSALYNTAWRAVDYIKWDTRAKDINKSIQDWKNRWNEAINYLTPIKKSNLASNVGEYIPWTVWALWVASKLSAWSKMLQWLTWWSRFAAGTAIDATAWWAVWAIKAKDWNRLKDWWINTAISLAVPSVLKWLTKFVKPWWVINKVLNFFSDPITLRPTDIKLAKSEILRSNAPSGDKIKAVRELDNNFKVVNWKVSLKNLSNNARQKLYTSKSGKWSIKWDNVSLKDLSIEDRKKLYSNSFNKSKKSDIGYDPKNLPLRPAIAKTSSKWKIGIVQWTKRFATSNSDNFDIFLPKWDKAPKWAKIIQSDVPSSEVRRLNLMSSRWKAGENPNMIDTAMRWVDKWVHYNVPKKNLSAPMIRNPAKYSIKDPRTKESNIVKDVNKYSIKDPRVETTGNKWYGLRTNIASNIGEKPSYVLNAHPATNRFAWKVWLWEVTKEHLMNDAHNYIKALKTKVWASDAKIWKAIFNNFKDNNNIENIASLKHSWLNNNEITYAIDALKLINWQVRSSVKGYDELVGKIWETKFNDILTNAHSTSIIRDIYDVFDKLKTVNGSYKNAYNNKVLGKNPYAQSVLSFLDNLWEDVANWIDWKELNRIKSQVHSRFKNIIKSGDKLSDIVTKSRVNMANNIAFKDAEKLYDELVPNATPAERMLFDDVLNWAKWFEDSLDSYLKKHTTWEWLKKASWFLSWVFTFAVLSWNALKQSFSAIPEIAKSIWEVWAWTFLRIMKDFWTPYNKRVLDTMWIKTEWHYLDVNKWQTLWSKFVQKVGNVALLWTWVVDQHIIKPILALWFHKAHTRALRLKYPNATDNEIFNEASVLAMSDYLNRSIPSRKIGTAKIHSNKAGKALTNLSRYTKELTEMMVLHYKDATVWANIKDQTKQLINSQLSWIMKDIVLDTLDKYSTPMWAYLVSSIVMGEIAYNLLNIDWTNYWISDSLTLLPINMIQVADWPIYDFFHNYQVEFPTAAEYAQKVGSNVVMQWAQWVGDILKTWVDAVQYWMWKVWNAMYVAPDRSINQFKPYKAIVSDFLINQWKKATFDAFTKKWNLSDYDLTSRVAFKDVMNSDFGKLFVPWWSFISKWLRVGDYEKLWENKYRVPSFMWTTQIVDKKTMVLSKWWGWNPSHSSYENSMAIKVFDYKDSLKQERIKHENLKHDPIDNPATALKYKYEAIDGDTVKIMWNWIPRNVRLMWVDTPESFNLKTGYIQKWWKEAKKWLKKKMWDTIELNLINDKKKTSTNYGRLLWYAYKDWVRLTDMFKADWFWDYILPPSSDFIKRSPDERIFDKRVNWWLEMLKWTEYPWITNEWYAKIQTMFNKLPEDVKAKAQAKFKYYKEKKKFTTFQNAFMSMNTEDQAWFFVKEIDGRRSTYWWDNRLKMEIKALVDMWKINYKAFDSEVKKIRNIKK